jgi:hypothetical protein
VVQLDHDRRGGPLVEEPAQPGLERGLPRRLERFDHVFDHNRLARR